MKMETMSIDAPPSCPTTVTFFDELGALGVEVTGPSLHQLTRRVKIVLLVQK